MKKVNRKSDKINQLKLKTKADLKEGPGNISHASIIFSFNWLVIIWRRGIRLKLDVQVQVGGRILDVDGKGGGGSYKLDNFHGRHMFITPYGFL